MNYSDFKILILNHRIIYNFRNAGIAGKPDNPVAYFTLDDDR